MTAAPETTSTDSRFLTRLVLKDYKSVAACDLRFGPLAVLVGPNASGKSNILDALRFVADSLRNSIEYALRDRGGIAEVRRRSTGHPRNFAVRLEMRLPQGVRALYAFEVGPARHGGFQVQREICCVGGAEGGHAFDVRAGQLRKGGTGLQLHAAVEPDRLYLTSVSALPVFRPVYDALSRMGFYNLNPERIRELQDPDPSDVLARDGRNMASLIKRLAAEDNGAVDRMTEYLQAVVPGVRGFQVKHYGAKQTIEFRQDVPGSSKPWRFDAANMSDGTLRALGVLVALYQGSQRDTKPIRLIGIEEPELAIHPAATNALADAILEATRFTQVILTSHSPDLLDNEDISSDSIIAVVAEGGKTTAGPVDDALRRAVRERLYTPGELLRIQQIHPRPDVFGKTTSQLHLFGPISQ